MSTMGDSSPPLRPRPFQYALAHSSPGITSSTSLEDGALFVASSRPGPTPTPAVRFRSITNAPRSHFVESATFSVSATTDAFSPYSNIVSRMRFLNKDRGGTQATNGSDTPQKGRDAWVNTNMRVDARKVLSPEAIFCDSPDSSNDMPSLSNISILSNRTIVPDKKTKRFGQIMDIRSSQPITRDSFSSDDSDRPSFFLSPDTTSVTSSTTSLDNAADDNDDDDDDDNSDDEEAFYMFDPLKRRGNLLHHRFPPEVAPYMQAYSDTALDNDYFTHTLLQRLCPSGSPSFHDYGSNPPLNVLDLGCGEGNWVADTAKIWKEAGTKVTAFDLVDLGSAVRARMDPEVAKNVSWVCGNFVSHVLPFKDNTFDLVRMANLTLAIPRSRWFDIFTDVRRILRPNGHLEVIDDQITFALQPPFSPSDYKENRRKFRHLVDTYDIAGKEQSTVALTPKEVWIKYERKLHSAAAMESIFSKMLDKHDIALHPHEFIPDILAEVFGPRNAKTAKTYQVGIPVGQTGGAGLPRRNTESEGSHKLSGYFDRLGKDSKNRQLSKDSFPLPISAPATNPGLYSSPESLEKAPSMNRKAMQMLVGDAPDTGKKLPAYQPTGLLIYPSTFFELDPDVVEMHACRSVHILLACKHALGVYVQELNESQDGRLLEREEEFDEMLWDYDCAKRFRMNWPHPYSQMRVQGALSLAQRILRAAAGKDNNKEAEEKASSKSTGGRRSQSLGGFPSFDGGVKPVDGNYLPVRHIRVFEATKN